MAPEDPLARGIVDVFSSARAPERLVRIGKPQSLKRAKILQKQLMAQNNIPTAAHRTFEDAAAAIAYLEEINAPVFIKADGPQLQGKA